MTLSSRASQNVENGLLDPEIVGTPVILTVLGITYDPYACLVTRTWFICNKSNKDVQPFSLGVGKLK